MTKYKLEYPEPFQAEFCRWQLDDKEYSLYTAACDNMHIFTEGNIKENQYIYIALIAEQKFMKFEKPGNKTKENKKNNHRYQFKKEERELVFNKYNGLCAYCGAEININTFQIDHKIPVKKFSNKTDADFFDNLMPSCRSCNIRKNTMSIERFRVELSRDIEQLKRDSPKFRLCLKYDLINLSDKQIEFYFERFKRGEL